MGVEMSKEMDEFINKLDSLCWDNTNADEQDELLLKM